MHVPFRSYIQTKADLSSQELEASINILQAYQIFNNMFNEDYRVLLISPYCLGGLIMITMSYLLIGFYRHIPIILITAVISTLIITYFIVYLGTKQAAELLRISSQIYDTFLSNGNQQMGKVHE